MLKTRTFAGVFAGHLGAALALKSLKPQLNLAWLATAAWGADVLLGCLLLLDVEHLRAPSDFALRHYLYYDAPYSHGVIGTVVVASLLLLGFRKLGAGVAVLLAGAYLSHLPLDALLHLKDIPLTGATSSKIGLGLWQMPFMAAAVELALVGLGAALYLQATHGRNVVAGYSIALVAFLAFSVGFSAHYLLKSPPTVGIAALSFIVPPVALFPILYSLDVERMQPMPR